MWAELVGPAGSGKSIIIRRVVEEIGENDVPHNCSGPLSKTGLFIQATGETIQTPGKIN